MRSRFPWIPMAALVATFAVVAAASFLPDRRLWGLNHLAFYPVPLRIACLAVIAVSFIPGVARRVFAALERIAGACARRPVGSLFVVAGAATAVFFVFRSATVLLGDGIFLVNSYRLAVANGYTVGSYFTASTLQQSIYPGTDLLNYIAFYAFEKLGAPDAVLGVRLLSCVFGGLFVATLLVFVRGGGAASASRWLAASFLIFSGAVQLFFGYVESYTPLLWIGLLYALFSLRALASGASIVVPVLIAVLAVPFHALSLILLPSAVVLVAWRLLGEKRRHVLPRIAVAIGAISIAALVIAQRSQALGRYLLSLQKEQGAYGMFSIEHVADMANLVLLILPAGLFFAAVGLHNRLAAEGPRSGTTAITVFAASVAFPCALFLLAFRPELGMARDWDLFSFAAAGFLLPALLALKRLLATQEGLRATPLLATPAIVLSLVLTASWIGLNASAQRSVSRYERILEYDDTHAGYAFETLAKHYEERGDLTMQGKALGRAYQETHNPRYLAKFAETLYLSNNRRAAITVLESLLGKHPSYDEGRVYLLGLLDVERETDELIRVSREGLARSPSIPEYHFYLGKALFEKGDREGGAASFRTCRELGPPERIRRAMETIVEQF